MQLTLTKFSPSSFNWDLLKKMYEEVLHEDSYWHFFWEGQETFIRCTRSSAKKLAKMCETHIITHTCAPYKENIDATKKYLHIFLPMFHCFSVMAMQLENGDLRDVLDRVCHCFLNTQTEAEDAKAFRKARMEGDDYTMDSFTWESLILGRVANARAFTIGRIIRGVESASIA